MTAHAPVKAAATVSSTPERVAPPSDQLPPKASKARAAPNEAPLLTPSSEGSARGLLNSVCITSPPAARAAPESTAVRAWGSRLSHTMKRAAGSAPASVSACHTSEGESDTVPVSRLRGRRMTNSRRAIMGRDAAGRFDG